MFKRIFSFLYWKQEIDSRGIDVYTFKYSYPERKYPYVIYKRTNSVTGSVKLKKVYLG